MDRHYRKKSSAVLTAGNFILQTVGRTSRNSEGSQGGQRPQVPGGEDSGRELRCRS